VGRASEFTREWAADRDPLHPSRRSISVLARVDDCALASEQVASREAVFPLHPIECDDGLVVEIAARGTLDLRERRALRELAGELRESMSASERVVLSRQTLSEFVCDRRYGWAEECEQQFGRAPGVICHEWNTAAHASEYEGRPGRRPLTAAELQRFFDHADAQVDRVAGSGRKGTLAAFRDAALFKVVYAWGLRRLEVVMLDVADLHRNAHAPQFGSYGSLHVRYGKASRGSAPKRRTVLSVHDWVVDALRQYVEEVRGEFDPAGHPALWLTERRGRVSVRHVNARFARYREAAGLPEELDLHCLRHSYVTHLIEAGCPERFVSDQVGHSYAATTAIYTGVSDDYKNRVLARVLSGAFEPEVVA
jgi:integrase/recombinase XerC